MRIAVTSVGAVLDDLEKGVGASGASAGLITTLPVLCFAGLGALTPRLIARTGVHRLLVTALAVMTVGLATRPLAHALSPFVLLSLLALAGGAVANICLPIVVKRDFPDRIGTMTAVYTTALAVGTTAGAGLTVPIGDGIGGTGDGWRYGLGSWAVLSALAVLPWLAMLRGDRAEPTSRIPVRARELARSRTAWALTLFFAFQSLQAYVAFGWFADFLHAHGMSKASAGYLVAVQAALSIPVSMVAPRVPPRRHRPLVMVLGACYLVAYVGLAVAPVGGALAWMVLSGIGSGMFPLALTLIGLRARTAHTTGALSAFVQPIGYVIGGVGPLLFGVLHGATDAWALPLAMLFVALGLAVVTGLRAARPCYVDDEIGAATLDTAR